MKNGQHHRHNYIILFSSQILAREEQTKSKVPFLSLKRFFGHDNIQFYPRNSAGSAVKVFWKISSVFILRNGTGSADRVLQMYEKETGLVFIDISGRENSRWIYCFYQFLHMHRSIKEQGKQKNKDRSINSCTCSIGSVHMLNLNMP